MYQRSAAKGVSEVVVFPSWILADGASIKKHRTIAWAQRDNFLRVKNNFVVRRVLKITAFLKSKKSMIFWGTMKIHTTLLMTGFIAMAAWGLTGCQSSSDTAANSTSQPASQTGSTSTEASSNPSSVAVNSANPTDVSSNGNPTEPLIGKKTFIIAEAEGGGHSPITGIDGGATQSAVSTIRLEFEQRGYVYQDSGPTDLIVTPKWIYSANDSSPEPVVPPGVPTATTPTTREATLNVVVRDAITGKVLWSEVNPTAVLTTDLSPDVAVGMAHQALDNLPAANPSGQYSNSSTTSSPAVPTTSGQPTASM